MTRNTPVESPFLSPGTKGLGLPAGGDVQEGAYLLPSRLYRRLRRLFQRAPARCQGLAVPPQGNALDRPRLYAIGDVHGRADLLERLLGAIEADAKKAGVPPSVVFLGDIVDRGPDSRACLDLVRDTLARWPGSRLLLGNHDDCLLSFFGEASLKDPWFASGSTRAGAKRSSPTASMPTIRRRRAGRCASATATTSISCVRRRRSRSTRISSSSMPASIPDSRCRRRAAGTASPSGGAS